MLGRLVARPKFTFNKCWPTVVGLLAARSTLTFDLLERLAGSLRPREVPIFSEMTVK